MATEADNVNSGALATLLAVGACATLGIALVVTALVRSETSDELEKKEVTADRAYKDLVAEQTAKLGAPAAYVNRGTGLVSLPIVRAMELVVSGLKKDPNSATPPGPVGGSGGAAATAVGGGGMGGSGGSGGAGLEGTTNPAPGEAPQEAVGVKPDDAMPDKDKAEGDKKGKESEKTGDKPDKKKKEPKRAPAMTPAPATPAPAPAAPPPAPAAPAPAPNGQ